MLAAHYICLFAMLCGGICAGLTLQYAQRAGGLQESGLNQPLSMLCFASIVALLLWSFLYGLDFLALLMLGTVFLDFEKLLPKVGISNPKKVLAPLSIITILGAAGLWTQLVVERL